MATRKELKIYGDLLYQHKPTIRSILLQLLINYFAKRNRQRRPVNIDNVSLEQKIKEDNIFNLPEHKINHFAIVSNKVVEQVIIVNPEIAELLKKRGTKIIWFDQNTDPVEKGTQFVDGKFLFNFDKEDGDTNEKD